MKVFRLCQCCGKPFYKNKNMNHTLFSKQKTCSASCGALKLSNTDYIQSKFNFIFSHTNETKSGCLEYTGYITNKGYGSIKIYKKPILVHRLIWEYYKGEIPDGLFICHHCDNPKCININHLFLGTNGDNMQDMYNKGRNNRKLKISIEDKIDMYELRKKGFLYKDIGLKFNISSNYARNSIKGIEL